MSSHYICLLEAALMSLLLRVRPVVQACGFMHSVAAANLRSTPQTCKT